MLRIRHVVRVLICQLARRVIRAPFAWATIAEVMAWPIAAAGQGIDNARAAVSAPPRADVRGGARADSTGARWPSVVPRLMALRPYAPIVSAIVPGGGQLLLGDDRFIAYVAVEALSWWTYVKDKHEQAAREGEFKELARNVARVHFSTTLPDTAWVYYEGMRDYLESGVYSQSPTGPIVPETDVNTYNGHQWDVAQGTQPTLAAALALYANTAVKPDFEWSWQNHRLEWDIFGRTTDKRNDAARAAKRDLIIIGANHMLSLVDAFTTIRLEVVPTGGGGAAIGASVRW